MSHAKGGGGLQMKKHAKLRTSLKEGPFLLTVHERPAPGRRPRPAPACRRPTTPRTPGSPPPRGPSQRANLTRTAPSLVNTRSSPQTPYHRKVCDHVQHPRGQGHDHANQEARHLNVIKMKFTRIIRMLEYSHTSFCSVFVCGHLL